MGPAWAAGRSFPLNDPRKIAPTMNLARYRDDAIELIGLLRRRYHKRKIFLMGHSWGSAVGLAVARLRPALRLNRHGLG
jgi:pimeloyl-ACP methyl ester carboxylesterase